MIEIAEALQTVLKRWDALIDRYDKADKRIWKKEMDNIHFPVMQIPPVLQLLGAPKDEIQIFGSFFCHAIRWNHPGMTLEVLRQIPKAATDPLMITKGSKPNSYVFVLELQDDNGATVVVQLELNKTFEILIDSTSPLHRFDDCGERIIQKYHITGFLCNICSGDTHGNADICMFDSRCIIDSVTGNRNNISLLLEKFDNSHLDKRRTSCNYLNLFQSFLKFFICQLLDISSLYCDMIIIQHM